MKLRAGEKLLSTNNFFAELKRRNVYKVAATYAVISWLLIQVGSILFPTFEAPGWVMKTFIVLVALGFPLALIFAWAFELTPTGVRRTEHLPPNETRTRSAGRKFNFIIVGLLLLAVALLVFDLVRHRKAGSATEAGAKSIAVLPFENLSEEKSNAYFADGVQDEILTDLAKIADLKVISRTSTAQYKSGVARNLREIAQQLGVTHILEGSVQRASGKVRVNAQLIDARTDAHVWANSYDRDLADVFAIQSEIAETIAEQLHAQLSASEKTAIERPPTTDLAAYESYLRAQALYADTSDQLRAAEKLPQAAQLLENAVARDPKFLLAWCRLSRVHGLIYWQGHDHTPSRLEMANAAVQSALRLDPNAGEAHLALADYYYHGFRDYIRAETELAIAKQTLPNNSEIFEYTGYIQRRQGRWEEATRNLERALELDPRNFFLLQQMALIYEAQRRYADQIRMYLACVDGDARRRADANLSRRSGAGMERRHQTVSNDAGGVDRGKSGCCFRRGRSALCRL